MGSARTAAPPAVSGMALVSDVTTGQPQAMASRRGSPNVSLRRGRRRRPPPGRNPRFPRADPSDEHDVSGDAELGCERVQRGEVLRVPAAADYRQLAILELVAGQRPCSQQPVAVLVRPQRRHEQHERFRDSVRSYLGTRGSRVAGLEQLVVDRLVDQLELAVIDLEVLADLGAQALGVDDDRIRSPRGPGITELTVGAGQGRIASGVVNACIVFMWITSDHEMFTTGAISVLKHIDAAERQPERRIEVLAERARRRVARSTTDR